MVDWNTVNWMIIFTGLLTIGAMGTLIVELYYRVYLPHKSQKGEVRKLIISILPYIEDVIREADGFRVLSIPTEVRKEIQDLPKYRGEIKEFFGKMERYNDLLKTYKNFIVSGLWLICCRYIEELRNEYEKLGVGRLADNLASCLTEPILKGDEVEISWLKDHYPEFCDNIKECEHSFNFRSILDHLGTLRREFIFLGEEFGKQRRSIIDCTNDLKKRLERIIK